MTERELKKLSRLELLELLLAEMKENERLSKELEEAKAALDEQRIIIENSGSLAEAALRLSGIFEAADKAAKLYLSNLDGKSEETEK